MEVTDFSKGNVKKNILRLAMPMTLAQLINVLYNIVDRIYIGRMQGGESLALTGVGVCLPVVSIIIAFANLVGMGGAPLFSIERGKKNQQEAEYILGNSLILLILFGVLLTVAGYIFKVPLLYLLGASEKTIIYANQYLSIYLIGNIFVLLSLGLNNFINAQGFGRTGMVTVAIGAGLNILLDPIFIYTFNFGVRGAALATVISQALAMMWTLRFLLGRRAVVTIRRDRLRLQAGRVGKILTLGLSGFTMSVTNSFVQMVCNASLQSYGGDVYVGIMTIINSLREVVTMPAMGISSATQPVLGYNYGAGEMKRVKQSISFMSVVLILYTLAIWGFLFVFPRFFMGIFTSNSQLIEKGIPCLHIYFFGFFFMALQFSGQSTFTGLGFSKRAIFFSIFRKVIIVIPLTLLLPLFLSSPSQGVFLAEPISNLIGGGACFATMMITVYRNI